MPTELNISARYAQWAIQGLTRLVGIFAILQGILVILTGRERWSGPAFSVAIKLPGAPPSWGFSLTIIGILILCYSFTKRMRGTAVGLFLFSLYSAAFATASLVAAITNPLATTSFTWPFFMVLGGCLSVIYWNSWSLNQSLAERVRNEIRDQAS